MYAHTIAFLEVWFVDVTTLALGLQLKQRIAKVHAKNEAQESHFMLPWL
jgi:hypothetical protein